jgi:putative membrane protein
MSQTAVPFWEWEAVGPFFGMPYENFSGWFGTGTIFMGIATLFWGDANLDLSREQLKLPFFMYLCNFAFATGMSLGGGIVGPLPLGVVLGLIPVVALYYSIPKASEQTIEVSDTDAAAQSKKIPLVAGR